MTKIVNIKYEKADIYIGRGPNGKIPPVPQRGCFGNPFKLGEYTLEESIKLFKTYFYSRIKTDETFKDAIHKLKNKKLGCFCKPSNCHGDVIKEYLDNT